MQPTPRLRLGSMADVRGAGSLIGEFGRNDASNDDIRLYIRIADQIRELALHHSLDLRTIDRALWTWDKRRSTTLRGRRRKVRA